ncbi:hypothetical protein AXE65_01965 [Ventosimonas gracilis]|uniref:DUF5983 domain-containing protein n=1 Tax=Ventosimonas gracilis TaxID=1680762 RepID=A0A139SUW4_9GAMM|nr:hypothetical protein AXE65_01965 [Ventosimonas gracilis]
MSQSSNASNPFVRGYLNLRVVQTQAPVYAIYGDDVDGRAVHIGDADSEQAAQAVAQRLGFSTGIYSRCWEISSAHLCESSNHYLMQLADIATPERFLLIAFRIPYSPAIGVKLMATPWTDANLLHVDGITADDLRQIHRDKGMPDDLTQVLFLASEADVRILIFDADAPLLPGLPVYELE